jgi:hypothetical protein
MQSFFFYFFAEKSKQKTAGKRIPPFSGESLDVTFVLLYFHFISLLLSHFQTSAAIET